MKDRGNASSYPGKSNPMEQILVIDDDLAIQMLLKRVLTKQGYHVVVASSGGEALNIMAKETPALVISDWIMPGISGLEVCRQIKSNPRLAPTFFILLTSLGTVEDKVKGLDAGADDFLCKPIELYELQARVRAGLRLHQLSRDLKQQKELLEAELTEAAAYVSSILPEPLREDHLRVETRFIPCSQLGGDSFDFYWLDEDHFVVYLLDVAGHGLRAALPSLSVINLVRSQGLGNGVRYDRPNEVMAALNQTFQINERNDKYFTMWYGIYERSSRCLTYTCGGHPPALLVYPDQTAKILKTPGFPVGMFPDAEYESECVAIPENSSLYVFSDGIYELNNAISRTSQLQDFLSEIQRVHHTEKSGVLDDLLAWTQQNQSQPDLDDDLSLLRVHFT